MKFYYFWHRYVFKRSLLSDNKFWSFHRATSIITAAVESSSRVVSKQVFKLLLNLLFPSHSMIQSHS